MFNQKKCFTEKHILALKEISKNLNDPEFCSKSFFNRFHCTYSHTLKDFNKNKIIFKDYFRDVLEFFFQYINDKRVKNKLAKNIVFECVENEPNQLKISNDVVVALKTVIFTIICSFPDKTEKNNLIQSVMKQFPSVNKKFNFDSFLTVNNESRVFIFDYAFYFQILKKLENAEPFERIKVFILQNAHQHVEEKENFEKNEQQNTNMQIVSLSYQPTEQSSQNRRNEIQKNSPKSTFLNELMEKGQKTLNKTSSIASHDNDKSQKEIQTNDNPFFSKIKLKPLKTTVPEVDTSQKDQNNDVMSPLPSHSSLHSHSPLPSRPPPPLFSKAALFDQINMKKLNQENKQSLINSNDVNNEEFEVENEDKPEKRQAQKFLLDTKKSQNCVSENIINEKIKNFFQNNDFSEENKEEIQKFLNELKEILFHCNQLHKFYKKQIEEPKNFVNFEKLKEVFISFENFYNKVRKPSQRLKNLYAELFDLYFQQPEAQQVNNEILKDFEKKINEQSESALQNMLSFIPQNISNLNATEFQKVAPEYSSVLIERLLNKDLNLKFLRFTTDHLIKMHPADFKIDIYKLDYIELLAFYEKLKEISFDKAPKKEDVKDRIKERLLNWKPEQPKEHNKAYENLQKGRFPEHETNPVSSTKGGKNERKKNKKLTKKKSKKRQYFSKITKKNYKNNTRKSKKRN